jgi:type IV pilus assembly protein PilN
MRFNINLATQPYEDAQVFWRQWGAALLAVFLLTVGLIYLAVAAYFGWRVDNRKLHEMQAQINAYDRETAQAKAFLDLPQNRDIRDKSQFINELIVRKAFSWTQVFSDLERIMPPRLHVVNIHPEMNKDNQMEIRMTVAGESRDRALDLVRKMEQSQRFREAEVRSESSNPGKDPSDNVQFEISALYVPPPPEAEKLPKGTPVPSGQKGGQ